MPTIEARPHDPAPQQSVPSGEQNRLLTEDLKRLISDRSHGAALVGVASIDRFAAAPRGHGPADFIPDAQAVVVIGLPVVTGLIDFDRYLEGSEVIREEDTCIDRDGVAQRWNPRRAVRNHVERRCIHEVINMELQTLSMYGALWLERAGFASTYLPTSYGQTFSWPQNLQKDLPRAPREFSPFSHRHAAVAAGLGTFGLSNLLLTPQYGPRIRLVSLITAAPLLSDPLLQQPVCLGESCSLCLTGCNGGDVFGEAYTLDLAGQASRLARIDKKACLRGAESCYKKCLTACPVGR